MMSPISKLSVKSICALLVGLSIPFTAPILSQRTGYANAQPQSVTFFDVSADYWATDYIEGLAQLNIITGFGDGTFKPNDPATRADVAAYVYQALVTEGRAEPLAVEAERRWQNQPVATIPSAIEQMSISGSGQQIATVPIGGNQLQIWNAQTGALIKEIPADSNRFNSIAISQDGTKVAAVDQNSLANTIELSVWSVETGDRLWKKSLGSAQGQPSHTDRIVEPSVELAFSLNDSQIVTQANLSQGNAQISVHDAATGDALQSLNLDDYKQGLNNESDMLPALTLRVQRGLLSSCTRI